MNTRSILILKGSPREKGNSSTLADQVAAGARAGGAQVESFVLQNMSIQPCNACEACHEAGDGRCILEDDMQTLYPKLRDADAIVLASPVYWFTMSAQLKLCIDRWYALEGPRGNALAGKQIGIVLTYGDSDQFTSGAINAMRAFEDMFRYIKADIVGMVHGTASNVGDAQKQPGLMDQAYALGQKLAGAHSP